jgi:hypothetical protein
MLDVCRDDMIGIRDRALISLGFAGAFRRSELAALRVDDLTECPEGYRVINPAQQNRPDRGGAGDRHPQGAQNHARAGRSGVATGRRDIGIKAATRVPRGCAEPISR